MLILKSAKNARPGAGDRMSKTSPCLGLFGRPSLQSPHKLGGVVCSQNPGPRGGSRRLRSSRSSLLHGKFKASLVYRRPCLKKQNQNKWPWWKSLFFQRRSLFFEARLISFSGFHSDFVLLGSPVPKPSFPPGPLRAAAATVPGQTPAAACSVTMETGTSRRGRGGD